MNDNQHKLKVDLHVHSPASIDYLGDKTGRGYTELAKAFVAENVDAIAITDHNTIHGYLEYKRQVEMTREAHRLMSARDESSEAVRELKTEVEVFDRLRVFPGVEITTYPGIHIILIFDEEIVPKVSDFLEKDLELGESVRRGDPAKCSKQSVVALLDLATECFGQQFFCILPHVESSKGAWSVLEGSPRVELFRDERIIAAQFSNPDTPDHVQKVITNASYKRKTPLSFIQCSDYHGEPNIKPVSQYSELHMPELLTFKELRDVLGDPARVRSSHEFVEERLDKYLKGRREVVFEFTNKLEIDASRRKDLSKALCGILNSPSAIIRLHLFNFSQTTNEVREEISKLFGDLRKDLDPSVGFDFVVSQFHQNSSRLRFCINIARNSTLRLMDGVCWVIDGPTPQPASAWRIEQIVARAHYVRVGETKQKALESASAHIIQVSSAFPAMSIAARLEPLLSSKRSGNFDVHFCEANFPASLKSNLGRSNGFPNGDFIQIHQEIDLRGGRLNEQRDYYRFSAPIYRYAGRSAEKGESLDAHSVIVFPEGGVNYVAKCMPFFAPFPICELKLAVGEAYSNKAAEEMALGMTSWLKSSFLLWYLNSIYQTDDVFTIFIQKRRLPLTSDESFIKGLSVYAKNILSAEQIVLSAISGEDPNSDGSDKIRDLLFDHNKSVRQNMMLIDKEIFRHLAFTADEVREAYRVLRVLNLYDYEIGSDLGGFLKDWLERDDEQH